MDYSKIRSQIRKVILGQEDPLDKSLLDQKLLLIGCGNSSLGHDMWRDGFTDVESMDYAESVIVSMKQKYRKMYSMKENGISVENMEKQLKFTHSDMLVMKEYPDDSNFDIVIDKATMDVIMTDNTDPWNPSE